MKKVNKSMEKVARRFSELMIQRIKDVDTDWNQPWIPVKRKNFLPQNITGRKYNGGNTLMLLIQQLFTNYRTPVYLTFKQAQERNIHIKKRESSFPVYHIAHGYIDFSTGEKINEKEYDELAETEKDNYVRSPIARCYDVFNLDQTDYAEKYPQEWEALLKQTQEEVILNDNEMFSCSFLDNVFQNQSWVCPIDIIMSNKAYYSPGSDKIVLPLKEQFLKGQEFYATALHEITHSTGAENRLKRIKPTSKRNDDYAKEELVAELSAALMSYYMGIEATIRDDNAAYLKHWIEVIKKEPSFLMSVLGDVVKAVHFTFDTIHFTIEDKMQNEKTGIPNIPVESEVLVLAN